MPAEAAPPLRFAASWKPPLPAEVLVNPAVTPLPVLLQNREPHNVLVRVGVRTEQDWIIRQVLETEFWLRAYETKQFGIALARLNAAGLKYSGKLMAEAVARATSPRGETAVALPHLYFHPAGSGMAVYGSEILRGKYGAGNFRNDSVPLDFGVREARRAITAAKLPSGVQPVVARVSQAMIAGQGGPASGVARRFCLVMPGEAFNDSSKRVWTGPSGGTVSVDYGEDFGRAGQMIPMARGWVAVAQVSGPLFSGFLNADGCTPVVPAAANAPTLIVFSPIYLHTGSNIRGFVSDLNLGAQWPDSMPLFLLLFASPNNQIINVVANAAEYAQTIYAAAARGMERFPGGSEDVLYEWRIREQGDTSGTGTVYAAEGHPRVNVKFSTAAQAKFTIVHEYGHAIWMARVNPPIGADGLDYSVTNEEGDQHAMRSKEWQLAAAVEGFAHFVATVAWNETSPNTPAVYVMGSDANPNLNDPFDFNQFEKYFESNWNPASYEGQGVETDWAQFFWNYHTDIPLIGVPQPSQSTLMALLLGSYPWPVNEGFFADFSGAASVILPTTVPPAIPAILPYQWFSAVASMAGIVH
jgi:hypothetical protein